MGIESASLMAASAVISAASAAYGGVAASQAANYQAEVAKQTAEMARQKARMAAETGAQEEEKLALQSQQQAGQIRAAFGASGVDVNSGSHALVEMGQSEMASTDQQLTREKTMRSIWGHNVDATSASNQAELYSAEATNALIGGGLKAGGSLVGGAGELKSKYGWFAE